MASLAVKKEIAPNSRETFRFYITWDFPNRYAWSMKSVGNYYSTKYTDAWDAAKKLCRRFRRWNKKQNYS